MVVVCGTFQETIGTNLQAHEGAFRIRDHRRGKIVTFGPVALRAAIDIDDEADLQTAQALHAIATDCRSGG